MTLQVIVTGGTGLIGRALVDELLAAGHQVTVLSRNPERHQSDMPAAVTLLEWDARTAKGWAEAAEGADAIVNLAGESLAGEGWLLPQRWTEERRHLIRHSRLNAGQAIVDAVAQAQSKPGIVVQSSAVGYYGPREDELVTESEPPAADFLASVCQDWEASTLPVEQMGVRRAIIRTGLVLSAGGGSLEFVRLPAGLLVAGPFGLGQQYWSWIHLKDVAKGIRFLIEHDSAAGAFNLTAPNPVTNWTFTLEMSRSMRRPFVPVPPFAVKLLVGDVSTVVLDGQRAVPQHLQELGFDWAYPQLETALYDLHR
ncbi:MAG: TIGR01777 family oxidoreductase [Candidatus Promineifilaceae bacterium]|nr:TIGR01777 family oxidoreductase [Candidatus Promineifilaceae bacterium]